MKLLTAAITQLPGAIKTLDKTLRDPASDRCYINDGPQELTTDMRK